MSQFWKPVTDNSKYIDRDSDAQSFVVNKRGNKRLTLTQQKESLPIFGYRTSILYALEKFSTLILVGGVICLFVSICIIRLLLIML
jgi:hypothetical protein